MSNHPDPADYEGVTPEFVAMLDEFIEENDEALRRLAGIPQPYLGAGREPSPREVHEAKLRETGASG